MVKCLVSLTCPGTKIPLRENDVFKQILQSLESHRIQYQYIDTMLGWGCLNQDWVEFTCLVQTSWGWCRPMFLNEQEWTEVWYPLLDEGKLLMQVYYHLNGTLVGHR